MPGPVPGIRALKGASAALRNLYANPDELARISARLDPNSLTEINPEAGNKITQDKGLTAISRDENYRGFLAK